jgi:hypothetical protein
MALLQQRIKSCKKVEVEMAVMILVVGPHDTPG